MALIRIISFIMVLFLLTSCSPPKESESVDYQKTKEIVLDVLQTQEGKQAFQKMMTDPQLKEQIMLDAKEIEQSMTKAMTNPKAQEGLGKLLAKPDVAASFSKATQKEMQNLFKVLMKDPEYQKSMMDIIKDPEFSKMILQLMKSQENRKETMKLIEEAMKSPNFQQKLMKLIQESAKGGGQPKQGQQGQGSDQGGGEEGAEGGSEQGGGG